MSPLSAERLDAEQAFAEPLAARTEGSVQGSVEGSGPSVPGVPMPDPGPGPIPAPNDPNPLPPRPLPPDGVPDPEPPAPTPMPTPGTDPDDPLPVRDPVIPPVTFDVDEDGETVLRPLDQREIRAITGAHTDD